MMEKQERKRKIDRISDMCYNCYSLLVSVNSNEQGYWSETKANIGIGFP